MLFICVDVYFSSLCSHRWQITEDLQVTNALQEFDNFWDTQSFTPNNHRLCRIHVCLFVWYFLVAYIIFFLQKEFLTNNVLDTQLLVLLGPRTTATPRSAGCMYTQSGRPHFR